MKKPAEPPAVIECPFTIIVDTREQHGYSFAGIRADSDQRYAPINVPLIRKSLYVGDYTIYDMIVSGVSAPKYKIVPSIIIERKSKPDLYQSMSSEAKRQNFIERLELMSLSSWAAVLVEAELSELMTRPPEHTLFKPKSLSRTIDAWMQRYPKVQWIFCPGREFSERKTFRLLYRWWLDHPEPQPPIHP